MIIRRRSTYTPTHRPRWRDNPALAESLVRPDCEEDGVIWSTQTADTPEELAIVGFDGVRHFYGGSMTIRAGVSVATGRGVAINGSPDSLWFAVDPRNEDFTQQKDAAGANLAIRTTVLNHGIAYCGEHTLALDEDWATDAPAFAGDAHVYLLGEYEAGGDEYVEGTKCRLLVCLKGADAETAGISEKWYVLIDPTLNSIRHFHGIWWFPKVGDDGRLVIGVGDASSGTSADGDWEPAMLTTTDGIPDLLENASTWVTRWGFDKTGTTKRDWFATADTNGANYCLDFITNFDGGDLWSAQGWADYPNTSQLSRTVELVSNVEQTYAWFIPDMDMPPGQAVLRVDLTTGIVDRISGTFQGTGWYGVRTASGTVVLTTESAESNPDANDDYLRIYAVNPDGESVTLLKSVHRNVPRADTASDTVKFDGAFALGDSVILPSRSFSGARLNQVMLAQPVYCGDVVVSDSAPGRRRNYCIHPISAMDIETEVDDGGLWGVSQSTNTVRGAETITMPAGYDRVVESVPTVGQKQCRIYYRLSGRAGSQTPKPLHGRIVTVAVNAMLPATADEDMSPQLRFAHTDSSGHNPTITRCYWPDAWRDGLWHDWYVSAYVPSTEEFDYGTLPGRLDVHLFCHYHGSALAAEGWVFYWTDLRIIPGGLPGQARLLSDGTIGAYA